jgi:hypothetical protein
MRIDIELLLTPKTAQELGAQLLAGARSIDANNMASLTTSLVDLREELEHSHNHAHNLGRPYTTWHAHVHKRGRHHVVEEASDD